MRNPWTPRIGKMLNLYCFSVQYMIRSVSLTECNFLFIVMQVMNNVDFNKMDASNLAIVFGPNLIWTPSAVASVSAMEAINSVTEIIIENVPTIFE